MDGQDNGGTGQAGGVTERQEFKDSVAAIEADLNGNLQVLSAHVSNAERVHRDTLGRLDSLFAGWAGRLESQYATVSAKYDGTLKQYENVLQHLESIQRRYDGVQQQFKGVQHQHDGIRQEFEAVRQFAQGLAQRLEATQQQCQVILGFEQQFKNHSETISAFEQRLAANAAKFSELSAAIEEEGRRRSNVEISIGEFSREIAELRTSQVEKLTSEVTLLHGAVQSGRRRQRLAIAAAVLALLAAGYVGLGKPGWPAATYAAVTPAR